MGTQPRFSAPITLAFAVILVVTSCGRANNSHNVASRSPSPSASAGGQATASASVAPPASPASSPAALPFSPPLGVLVGSQAASSYTSGTVRAVSLDNPAALLVSPDGQLIAFADPTGTRFTIGASPLPNMAACTWIDNTHVMSGGDAQHQPRVADVGNASMVAVQAAGDCGGRLPGGL